MASPLNKLIVLTDQYLTPQPDLFGNDDLSKENVWAQTILEALSLQDELHKIQFALALQEWDKLHRDFVEESIGASQYAVITELHNHLKLVHSRIDVLVKRLQQPFIGEFILVPRDQQTDVINILKTASTGVKTVQQDIKGILMLNHVQDIPLSAEKLLKTAASLIASYTSFLDAIDAVRQASQAISSRR